jgi:serine/threonine-protein kinase
MGSVWAATHLTLRSNIAVKLIDRAVQEHDEAFRRFAREARATAALRSPHVVQVLDYGVEEGRPYVVMELLEGESLATSIARCAPISPATTWRVISQTSRAVARAHTAGIVHRDLKPDNVFLVDDDGDVFVKVLDFGLARALEGSSVLAPLTAEGAVVLGSVHYASPEQIRGEPVHPRVDLWSLAVIAFECLTGFPPFDGPTPAALVQRIVHDPPPVPSSVARVPQGFDAWFAKATHPDPLLRFQSARDLMEELRGVLVPRGPLRWVGEAGRQRSEPPASVRLSTYPRLDSERRAESRAPSSIPAALNGRQDLQHAALIYNVSRTGALLASRLPCSPNTELRLTLHVDSSLEGHEVGARVVRVALRDRGTSLWKYELGVRFDSPLSEELLKRIEARQRG